MTAHPETWCDRFHRLLRAKDYPGALALLRMQLPPADHPADDRPTEGSGVLSLAPDSQGITTDKLERALVEYDRAMREEVIPAINEDLRRQALIATRLRLGLAPDTEIPSASGSEQQ